MTKTQMLLMRATRFALPIVAGLLSTQALATGIRVIATTNALPPSAVVAGEFGFALTNEGTTTFDSVRLVVDPGHEVECAESTAQSRSFAIGGLLRAGDRVTCIMQPVAGAHHAAGISVIASSGSAPPQVRHVTFTPRPTAALSQGIVVLAAGAILQDANADGNLDVGETIAYNYSVVNLGTLALSGLAVTDNDGAVTCPQTTLAPDANMVCMSNHAINATDAGAGMVANQIDISGTDGAGPVAGGDYVLTINQGGTAGIRMFKSPLLSDDVDNSGYASTGDVLRYTFVVKNSNAQSLSAVNVIEPDPTRIDPPIDCAATTLGGQAFAGLGSGVLQSNDVVLCTAGYTINATDASSGSADNLAESSGQPAIGTPANGTAASAVVIPTPADLTVVKTHSGTFVRGQSGGIYTLIVSNVGIGPTLGPVTVVDTLPVGLIADSISGAGWNCILATLTCTRSDVLLPGNSYPVITITVTVAADAPAAILNTVVVSGGDDINPNNNFDDDPVTIITGASDVMAVPVDARWALLLMIGLLLVLARRKVKLDQV